LQGLGGNVEVSAAVFYSRLHNIIKESDADQSYAGLYHGWPVDSIDFAVNEGHATTYGSSLGLRFLRALGVDRRFQAHAALTMVDGVVSEEDDRDVVLPIGGMAPLQLRFGADLDWDRWSVAPRLAVVGRQRVAATILVGDSFERRTLDGYATMDVNLRRREVFKHLDAFVTLENALDRRYRTINLRAFTNPEELIGAPQNPRRITVGFDWRLK
jgi:outer membrane receptor protein involved in Fe transport